MMRCDCKHETIMDWDEENLCWICPDCGKEEYVKIFEDEEEKEIKKRLKKLGYLD